MANPSAPPLLRLLRYGNPYRGQVWGATICSTFRTLFDLAPPYLIGVAIDVVVINQLERFLNSGAQDLISFFTRVLAVGLSFVLLAPGIAWFAMVPIPIILWGTFLFQSRLAPRYDAVRDQAGLISDRLSNNLSGMATIKSFTAERYESDRFYHDSNAYRRSNQRAIALSVAFQPVLRFCILLGFVLTLYLGGRATLAGQLSVGTYGFMVFIV